MSDKKTIPRDPSDNGWLVEYELVQKIERQASLEEPVSMEAVEAVILELAGLGFVTMAPKESSDKPAPIYTSELPTEPGYYWFDFGHETEREVIRIKSDPDGNLYGIPCGMEMAIPLWGLVEQGGRFGPRISQPEESPTK